MTEPINLLAALTSKEAKPGPPIAETRQAIEAADHLAVSVDKAIQSLHSFVGSVTPGPDSNAAPKAASGKRPFDILDYGKTATRVAEAAVDLNTLLNSVNETATPKLAPRIKI